MPRAVLVVMTNPVESRDVEYNQWYDDQHVPEVLEVPGFKAATRYRVSSVQMLPDQPVTHHYLAVYEVEAEDLEDSMKALGDAAARGMFISDALDMKTTPPAAFLYEEITARQTSGS